MEYVQNLYKKPYIKIPFPLSEIQIQEAMRSFFKFLDLSEEKKRHIDLNISPLHRRGDIGFKHRSPKNDIYNDSKDFFHYHPIILEKYSEFMKGNPVVKEFLENAYPIWQAVYKSTKEILSSFEVDYPGTLRKIFDTDTPHVLLRFLRYDYAKAGFHLAKPHFDAGSFTMAIAESNPGLRIGTNTEDLEPIEHKENEAIFMVSSNVKKIMGNDKLKPAWHDVIQVDESKIDKSFSRWAMVAFIEGHSVESLSREETHKFYQGFEKSEQE